MSAENCKKLKQQKEETRTTQLVSFLFLQFRIGLLLCFPAAISRNQIHTPDPAPETLGPASTVPPTRAGRSRDPGRWRVPRSSRVCRPATMPGPAGGFARAETA